MEELKSIDYFNLIMFLNNIDIDSNFNQRNVYNSLNNLHRKSISFIILIY